MAKKPETTLQGKIIDFLEARAWLIETTHGNAYQKGIPDLFCWNEKLDIFRWVDVKRRERHVYTELAIR